MAFPRSPIPNAQNSKTVSSTAIPFYATVRSLDPEFEREKHDSLTYPFGEAGHQARDFYADLYQQWPYGNTYGAT